MTHFCERYADRIVGVISCLDRVIIQGTLPDICHAKAITAFFYGEGIRIFDFKQWAAPMRDQIRDNIEALAADNRRPAWHRVHYPPGRPLPPPLHGPERHQDV